MPIAATSQSVAAVVRPRTERPCRMIAPAPRKPMPVTICAAIRDGSVCGLVKPYTPTSVNSAAPTQTTRCVRRPACRSRSSRSRPIAPPRTAATKSRSRTPAQPMCAARARRLGELMRDSLGLERGDLADPGGREPEQLVERLPREGVALGGRLHLDEPSVAGHDDVHVGVGARVL